MKKFEMPNPYEIETHKCESRREGDWIIFTCRECSDYERRYNWRTGSMKVTDPNPKINHNGEYAPTEALYAYIHRN